MTMVKLKKSLTIVPIMISYDRIFEQGNLTQEMITGEQEDYTLKTTFQSLINAKLNSYGETYIKYLEPINMKSFLTDELKIDSLSHNNFESAALQLT